MSGFKDNIQKGKIELIVGAILLLTGIVITYLMFDSNIKQSNGLYTLMFAPIIAGAFIIIMGLFKK